MSHRDHHHDHDDHDLEPIRADIRRKTGREFWRSLEELSGTDKFREFLHREFPSLNAPDTDPSLLDPTGRRNFMKLMGASLALAGLTACTKQPKELIVPYVKTPDGLIPGKTQYYATAMPQGGVANGLLVESHEGRPTKIEGNPDHPSSLGATNVFAQASVLNLYDPDRAQTVTKFGEIQTWSLFVESAQAIAAAMKGSNGAGFRILTGIVTSPTLAAQIQSLRTLFPKAKWHQWEPAVGDGAREGAKLAFGSYVNTIYRPEKADVILSLDSDFLGSGPGHIRYAREFSRRRNLDQFFEGDRSGPEMNRLYVVEPTPSVTGATADHRLPLRASEVELFARALVAKIIDLTTNRGRPPIDSAPPPPGSEKWLDAVAKDLSEHRGKSLVVAGEHQP